MGGARAPSAPPRAAMRLRFLARAASRSAAAAAAGAGAPHTPPPHASSGAQLLAALRSRPLALTMEFSAGAAAVPWPAAAPAWASLHDLLSASVHTDLPQMTPGAPPLPVALSTVPPEVRLALPRAAVQAVAAHVRSGDALEARLRAAGAAGAAALLLVSGDASSRASTASATPALLRAAARLRASGALPPDTALLAAANPLTEPASALLPKLDAGAQALVTQPALLPSRASRWWDAACAPGGPLEPHHGGATAVPVLVGLALPTSERDVALWLRLAEVSATDPDAAALLAAWRAAGARGADALAAHADAAALAAIAHAAELPGVAGVHLMPLTRAGYALAASPALAEALRRAGVRAA
jgi:5,10-methylenetetrahydrofolate reductase